jgi:uncharacterized membrane protein
MDDPQFITAAAWAEVGDFLTALIVFAVLVIGFAGNLLVAHALIPSLVASEHISSRANRIRPVFYLASLVLFVGAITFLTITSGLAGVIGDIYDRWWI